MFLEKKDYKVDLVFFEVTKEYKAKGDALWFFVDREYQADFTVFWTDKEYKADLNVFKTDKDYKAKWNKNHKLQSRIG